MKNFRTLSVGVLFWLGSSLAGWASEDAGHVETVNPMTAGSIWNSIATLVTFGIVIFALGKFAWGPLLRVLQDREKFIRESLQSAKRDREAAEKTLKDYEQRLFQARQEATAIVDEGRRDAEVLRRKIHEEAKKESDAMLERAKREIGLARDTAVKDLYTLSGRLATDLAARIIEKEIDSQTHERLIQQSIDRIAQLENRN